MRYLSGKLIAAGLGATAMLAGAVSQPANAAIVSTPVFNGTFTAPVAGPNCVGNTTCTGVAGYTFAINLPRFNPATYGVTAGDLIDYVVTLSGSLTGTLTLKNLNASPISVNTNFSVINGFIQTDGVGVVPYLANTLSQTFVAAGYPNPQTVGGNATVVFGPITAGTTLTTGLVNTGLGAVTGLGSFSVGGDSGGNFSIQQSGGSSGSTQQTTLINATISATVQYRYENANQVVTPEPASIALLGAGLVGAGLVRRRRRAA